MKAPTNVLDLFKLTDQVAIITGGSKGLGRAIALAFAQAGANLVIASRSEDEIQRVAQELAAETGQDVVGVRADVTSMEDAERIVRAALDAFGKLDILVNSAGVNNRKPISDLAVEEFEELIDINLTGTFRMCKAAEPALLAQGSGRVVNLSSMLDHITIPGRTGYAASKGGVLMLTKTLALEWASAGVRVNALSPGPFATPLNRPVIEDPEQNRLFLQKLPVGRWGEPFEVGAAALYLASPAADFVTGTTLYIDGGWTAQ
jgi:NAD(P)-dependent dehydrogenase (short-subunit alcohol dehydrogenase family)